MNFLILFFDFRSLSNESQLETEEFIAFDSEDVEGHKAARTKSHLQVISADDVEFEKLLCESVTCGK